MDTILKFWLTFSSFSVFKYLFHKYTHKTVRVNETINYLAFTISQFNLNIVSC